MAIGEKIKELRERKKVTQSELADAVGTTKQNIYKYETGIITNIPSDRVETIAKYFNVSPAYLMGWEDKNPTPADDSRSEVYEVLNKLSDSDLVKVESFIKGLLAQDSGDK